MVQFSPTLDQAFAALADSTRRGILETLGKKERATISELAAGFDMTLTGMKKHVQVLEDAKLVVTEKVGRVRHCRLGPHKLDKEQQWIESYREVLEGRMDRLAAFLRRNP